MSDQGQIKREEFPRNYCIVQILKPGRVPERRTLKVVCWSWLFTAKKGAQELTYYCKLPAENQMNCHETMDDLAHRLITMSTAPEEWTTYRVLIRGRDGKYD